ncbi:hypothetical protein [Variovorax sp. N23]|uniref:hypothetical protein n=1 Tax=Variovorax sp. N23 TaxID=2980555 RepID=UPI0021C8196C|nr:hypothetical protein [Variovorax sp. N23]MCU4119425.1 hypothetical protein [Variovorax sp. N23]
MNCSAKGCAERATKGDVQIRCQGIYSVIRSPGVLNSTMKRGLNQDAERLEVSRSCDTQGDEIPEESFGDRHLRMNLALRECRAFDTVFGNRPMGGATNASGFYRTEERREEEMKNNCLLLFLNANYCGNS